MSMYCQKENVRKILVQTILALCNNGLQYDEELSIEGLLGITVDHKEIILVNIKEILKNKANSGSSSDETSCDSYPAKVTKKTRKRRASSQSRIANSQTGKRVAVTQQYASSDGTEPIAGPSDIVQQTLPRSNAVDKTEDASVKQDHDEIETTTKIDSDDDDDVQLIDIKQEPMVDSEACVERLQYVDDYSMTFMEFSDVPHHDNTVPNRMLLGPPLMVPQKAEPSVPGDIARGLVYPHLVDIQTDGGQAGWPADESTVDYSRSASLSIGSSSRPVWRTANALPTDPRTVCSSFCTSFLD